MRSRLLAILAVFSLSVFTQAEDFGEAAWGDTRAQIREAEKRPNLTPITAKDYLIYEASLPGVHRTRLIYQFSGDRLVSGRFIFEAAPGASTRQWINEFEQVRTLVSQQYGAPEARQAIQAEPGKPVDPEAWDLALAADRLILKTQWQLENTTLVQQLAWKQRGPHHQLIYRPAGQNVQAPTTNMDPVF